MSIDPFSSAIDMLQALDAGSISSVELTRLHIDRIEQLDDSINAVVVRDFERALEGAREADELRSSGEQRPLLGLPMTVKDAFYVEGLPATGGGIPERAGIVADWDAPAVAAIKRAGGIILGKTNMPPYAADHQSNNPLYGRTSNPWNLGRTPGGSSGGSAAALAAGMTPLEIGGDYGGSIRVPSAYCGVFGHKTSEAVWPRTGHFPVGRVPDPAFVMAVQGPMARSAVDLELLFGLIAGPEVTDDTAWRLELPAPRAETLSGLRVAMLPEFDWLPLDEEIAGAHEALASKLARAGSTVGAVDPLNGEFLDYTRTYLRIFFAQSGRDAAPETAQGIADELRSSRNPLQDAAANGWTATVGDYLSWVSHREMYQDRLRSFFGDWDILLAPCTITNAYPHTDWPDDEPRMIEINGLDVSTIHLFSYPGLCSLSGHPGTAFPVGSTTSGLPIGLQAIGPYLEDRTSIEFARLVEQEFGGFVPPPDFVN